MGFWKVLAARLRCDRCNYDLAPGEDVVALADGGAICAACARKLGFFRVGAR